MLRGQAQGGVAGILGTQPWCSPRSQAGSLHVLLFSIDFLFFLLVFFTELLC